MRLINADKLILSLNDTYLAQSPCGNETLAVQDYRESVCEGLEMAIKTVEEFPTIDGWISVKDRLPSEHDSLFANNPHLSKHMWAKESDDVIVYVVFPDGTGRATEGRLRDGKWNTKISQVLEPVITHWMPLPEPPKEVMLDGDQ